MKIFYKIKYFFGTIYRGMIGVYHNAFDKCPEINSEVEWFSIGETMQGKKIRCYFVRNKGLENKEYGISNNKILIVGGIHGNEVGTVKLASRIINWFYNSFKNMTPKNVAPSFSWEYNNSDLKVGATGGENINVNLFVIPCLNLDGYEKAIKNPDYWHRGRIGRFNARGVDLNRNFPTKNFEKYSKWGFGRNYSDEKIKIFCGEFGASEPETVALIKFIQENNIKNLIMLHNVGKDVVYNKDDEVARSWAEIYHKFTKFKIRTDLGYSGSVAEWAREQGIHYMTVEGSSRWGSDWKRQKRSVLKVLK